MAAASVDEMTVSDTTVEGELIAESGSTVVFGGPLTGSGIFTHAAQGSTLTSVIDVSSLTNSGALSLSGGTLASADVFNSGNIEAVSASVLNPGASGTFANSGTIDIQDSVVLALENGRLEHGGTIDLNTSGTLSVVGGVLDLETDGVLAGAGQVLFAGDLSLDTGVSFTLSSTEFVFDGGEIIGDGSLVNQSAVRFAADSTVAGTLTNEGALSIEGASVTANGIGLSSGGTVTLDGSSADSSLTDSSGVLLNAGAVSVVGGTGSLIGTTVNNASGGTITVANGATLQKSGGTLVNAGEIEIENGGDLAIGAASGTPTQVENTGAVTANGNLTLLNTVFTHAAGDLDIDDGGSLGLNGGSTLDLGADVTIGTLGTLGLGDGGATAARVSGTGTLRNRGDLVFDNGVAAVDIINFGDLTTNNSQYDVAGTLTFQGGGTIDLTGANVLAGGGLYDFSVNTDLTEDTVASGTTVSVTSGSALSLTNTVVDGTLIAETGASVTYGGTLTGTGLFEHAVQGSTLSSTIDVSKLTNSGRLILSGGTVASADFVNSGNLDIVLASTVNPGSSGTFTNSDTVDIQNGIGLTFGAGVLANSGTIDLNASGTLSIAGGTLDLGAGGAVDGSGQARFSGNLNIGTGVTFTLSSTEFVFEGGDITGPGALINQGYVGFEADGAIGVAFTNEGTLSIDGASVTASEIELTSSGTLTLDGSSSDASLADSSGVLLNAGLVSLTAGIGSLSATTVSNASGATISVDDGATLRQDGGGTFLNAGEIALSGVLEITVGEAANTGALTFTAGTLDLSGGAVFDQTPDLTLSAGSEIVLDNSTLTGAGTLSIGGSVAFANNGVLALTAVNSGSVSTSNNRYDVSGSLATEGAGSIDLVGSKVLAGGGAYSFSNDFDLTTDTVAVSTTVSALSGSTMTVSDTTVDGELIAASGSAVVFGGDVTGAGSFDHAAAGSTLSATIDVSTLTNSGALELSSGTLASLNIENSGLLDVTASAVADPGAGGTLRNSGTIETQNGQVLTFDNGLLAHSGTIDLNTTGTLSVANGTFDVAAGSVFTGSGQARFAGDFNIGSGVTFTLSTAKFLFEGGDIAGDGTFVNQSDVNFTSDAAIAGAFTNNDSISIANASVTANDIGLSSGGTVSLDGTVFDAALTDSSGSLLNAGLVAVTAGTASLLATTVSNASGGTISVDDGATLQQDGGGTFLNEGDIALAGVLELAGGETSNTGALTFTSGTLELSGGAVFDQTPNLTLSAGSEIVLDDSTLTGAGTLSISGSVAFANNGALDLTAVNSGSVTTSNDRYDVSGSLATDGVGSVDLVGSKTLAGGGSYTFANDFDLSADTVAASTTVSALSGSTITVSDTVVEGALNAASGSDLAIDGTVTGGGSLSIAGSATFGSLGVLGIATVNTGTISAVDGQFDVSGSLATEGTGALDLSGSKTLAGGGAYTFANDANLTADTIAASTTVSALNGTTMTVSDTTVDGTLIAASGSNLSIDGTVTGGGALSIFGSAVFGTAGVLDVVAVNAGTVSTGDGTYDVSGSLATEGVGTVDLSGTKTLAGGGAYTFVNDFDLTADTVAASTTVSALNGSTLAVSDTTVDGALIAANGSDLSIDGTVTGSGTLSIAGSAALGTVGLIDVVAVNTGTLSADDSQFDVSGSLATEGSGALDLLGSKTLAGGGAYTFANDVDLTDDTVAASTTVSALSGSTLTVSTTTVDGVLIAASGSDLSIDGTVTGGGTLLIAGAATLGSLGVLDVVTVNTSTVSTVDGQYDVSGSLATEVSGALDLLGSKILAGGGAYTFANAFNLTADTIAASTAVSALSGSTLTVLDTIVDGTLIAESGSSVAFGGTLTGAGAFTHAALASTLSNVIDIAEFTNSGTMALSGGTVASADATNSGLLDVLTDSEIDPGVGGTFVNIGTIEIQDAVVLTLDNAALVNSGTIGIGDGASISMTTAASIQNAGGIINIGTGFGVATADGDISFDLTSRLLTDLGGTTAGTEHDQLAVTGTLTLGGTLDVSEVGTFSVGDGNSFQIIDTSAGTLAGSFDSVTGLETGDDFILDLTHNATGVSLVSRTVTVLGDDTGTTLTGTSGVDVILAKAGDDTIDGSGDTDLMHGGAGNDIFIAADVGFGRLDGGADFDLIDFTGDSDLTFNLTTLRGDQLSNIERIDISGTGTVGLVIDLDTVLSATGGTNSITGSDNDLIIDGDTGDTVDAGAGWVNTGTTTIAEINGYTVFENADSGAQIFVNSDVAVTIT